MNGSVFFRFKNGSTFLHRMGSVKKLLLMVLLSLLSFYVPPFFAVFLYFALILFSAVYLKFSFSEIFTDSIPCIIYAATLYAVCLLSNFTVLCKGEIQEVFFKKLIFILTPEKKFFSMSIHLFLSVEVTSVFYRTTSPHSFNQAFRKIENFVTKKNQTPVADCLAFTINFIPRIARLWTCLDNAWKARGGKKNVRRISKLTPTLFKTAMSDAYKKSLARMNRENLYVNE